jgi:nucleotide-binding universal stress UspA family protein
VAIAEAAGRVTVAMADPEDPEALATVQEIYGEGIYTVRCDSDSIDKLLGEIWSQKGVTNLRVYVWSPWATPSGEFSAFAQHLALKLGATLIWEALGARNGDRVLRGLGITARDMVLCSIRFSEGTRSSRMARHLRQFIHRCRSTILLVTNPRLPLRRILLFMQGGDPDLAALRWVQRLSTPGDTVVTALACIPPVPAVYSGLRRMEVGVDDVLSTNSRLGIHLRQVAAQLAGEEIEGHLRIRQGAPDLELGAELEEGEYDLVAVGAGEHGPIERILIPGLPEIAMKVVSLPLLITRGQPEAWEAEGVEHRSHSPD